MDRQQKAPVYRITIDERLNGEHVRLLIAPLVEGVQQFGDRPTDWEPERIVLASRTTYVMWMGVRRKELPWRTLEEGQVFLVGEFKVLGNPKAPRGFRVCPGAQALLRIDQLPLVKERAKRLYSALVRGEEARDG